MGSGSQAHKRRSQNTTASSQEGLADSITAEQPLLSEESPRSTSLTGLNIDCSPIQLTGSESTTPRSETSTVSRTSSFSTTSRYEHERVELVKVV